MNELPQQSSERSREPSTWVEVDQFKGTKFKAAARYRLGDVAYVMTGHELHLVEILGFSYTAESAYDGAKPVVKIIALHKVRYKSAGQEWIPAGRVFRTRAALLRNLKPK